MPEYRQKTDYRIGVYLLVAEQLFVYREGLYFFNERFLKRMEKYELEEDYMPK